MENESWFEGFVYGEVSENDSDEYDDDEEEDETNE
jgi:hypothetical protein